MGLEVQTEDCSPPICPTRPKISWYKMHVLHSLSFQFRGGRMFLAIDNRHPRQNPSYGAVLESVEGVWPGGLVSSLHSTFTEQPR